MLKNPKTIQITAKCSDMFSARFLDGEGKQIAEYDGYVPPWFPNTEVQHYGDYVELTIDVDTGRILNWVPPTVGQIEESIDDR